MHKGKKLRDAAKYAVLAAAYASDGPREGTVVNPADVGGYRTKTVRAGEFLYISCYPLIGCSADREQRKRLEEFSADRQRIAKLREKYAKFNNKRRITEFEQLVHANMEKGDLHITCTYDLQNYDQYASVVFHTREEARKEVYNFLRRVKRLLKRNGCNLDVFRWICVTVTKESMKEAANPRPDAHHHHLLLHGAPQYLRNEIERLWPYGFCNADRLQDSENGFAAVAGYVARQESSVNGENGGIRSFTTSRNIIRPRVTTSDSKISRRRAALIAADVLVNGREIFEKKLFPGFRLVEDIRVTVSDYVAGAYIYAKLRRKPASARKQRCRHMRN